MSRQGVRVKRGIRVTNGWVRMAGLNKCPLNTAVCKLTPMAAKTIAKFSAL